MATLSRDDGLQFVIQPYRELLELNRGSILKRTIRTLAGDHGRNVRLFKQNDGRLEVILSRDIGFLLGETIWFHLNKPNNMIYCEELPERRQALIVVVRDGVVFLDAKMLFTNLIDEFISLSVSEEKYDIYVYGDVPLGDSQFGGKYVFADKNVKSFKVLNEPLLPKLPIYEQTQMQPLELALASPLLGKPKFVPFTIVGLIVVLVIILWHFYGSAERFAEPKIQLVKPKPVEDPYLSYYRSLMTPWPQKQVAELISVITLMHGIPGWNMKNISYGGSSYSVTLALNGGSVMVLQNWAKTYNVSMVLQQGGAILVIPSSLSSRDKPTTIFPLDQVLGLLMDKVNLFLPGNDVNFSGIMGQGVYSSSSLAINIKGVSSGILMMLGTQLNDLPITVNNMTFSTQNDLFSGSIALQVLGD